MTIFCEFFKHNNFGGSSASYTLTNSWRYYWIKFGSPLKNEITSIRARTSGGFDGNVYGFTKNNFLGDFSSLNVPSGWTSWWNHVGSARNDDIESALMIHRNQSETVIELTDQVAGPFATQFDAAIQGTQLSRRGEPKIYAVFWPSFDPSRKFVRIEQNLRVAIDWWPDYDARVQYDVYFYLDGNTVRAYVAWTHCWVEGGIFSGQVLDEMHPQLAAGAADLTAEIRNQLDLVNLLAALGGLNFGQLYLVPGNEPVMPPPSSNFGRKGKAKENCTLVLTT